MSIYANLICPLEKRIDSVFEGTEMKNTYFNNNLSNFQVLISTMGWFFNLSGAFLKSFSFAYTLDMQNILLLYFEAYYLSFN